MSYNTSRIGSSSDAAGISCSHTTVVDACSALCRSNDATHITCSRDIYIVEHYILDGGAVGGRNERLPQSADDMVLTIKCAGEVCDGSTEA